MTSRRTLTLLLALSVSGCSVATTDCAGWQPIRVAGATLDYLAADDREALADLIAHHEYGQARGCWR